MSNVLPPNVDPLRPGASTNSKMGLPRFIRLSAMALALTGVAAFGVIVYSAYKTSPTTPDQVPLITADSAPLRVRPADEGGMHIANRDSTVYSQLDGQVSQPGLERLVPPPEQPLDPVAPEALPEPRRPDGTPALTSEEIRIMQQQRRLLQQQRGDAGEQAMQQLAEAASNLPAGVDQGYTSTVVAQPERIEPPAAALPVAAAPEPVTAPAESVAQSVPPASPADLIARDTTNNASRAVARQGQPPQAQPAAPTTTDPSDEQQISSLSPAQIAAQRTRPLSSNPAEAAAAIRTPAPSAETPATPSAQDARRVAAIAPAAGGATKAIQLGAVRSQDAAKAEWTRLQAKFRSQLGSLAPQIQQADLGARGVYWRIRGVSVTEAQGKQICDTLKAAGQSCLVVAR